MLSDFFAQTQTYTIALLVHYSTLYISGPKIWLKQSGFILFRYAYSIISYTYCNSNIRCRIFYLKKLYFNLDNAARFWKLDRVWDQVDQNLLGSKFVYQNNLIVIFF